MPNHQDELYGMPPLTPATETDWLETAPPEWRVPDGSINQSGPWLLREEPVDLTIAGKETRHASKNQRQNFKGSLMQLLAAAANCRDGVPVVYILAQMPAVWGIDVIVCQMFSKFPELYSLCRAGQDHASLGSLAPWTGDAPSKRPGDMLSYHVSDAANGRISVAFAVYPVGASEVVMMQSAWRPGATTSRRAPALWRLGAIDVLSRSHDDDGLQFNCLLPPDLLSQSTVYPIEGAGMEYKALQSPLDAITPRGISKFLDECMPPLIRSSPEFHFSIGVNDLSRQPSGFVLDAKPSDLVRELKSIYVSRWESVLFPLSLTITLNFTLREIDQVCAGEKLYGLAELSTQSIIKAAMETAWCQRINSYTATVTKIVDEEDSGYAALLFDAPCGKFTKLISSEVYDIAIIPRYVLEIHGVSGDTSEAVVGRECMYVDTRLNDAMDCPVVEMFGNRIVRLPATHCWLRLRGELMSPGTSTVLWSELYHRFILSRDEHLFQKLPPTAKEWIKNGDIFRDPLQLSQALIEYASHHCVLLVHLESHDDAACWSNGFNAIQRSSEIGQRAARHWTIVIAASTGTVVSEFVRALQWSLDKPHFEVRDAFLVREVLLFPRGRRLVVGSSGVPHRQDLPLQVRAVDDAIVAATKKWLREGAAVPFEAMQADLVAPSEQRSNLVCWLRRAASKNNGRTVLLIWEQAPSSGATTLLRTAAWEMKQLNGDIDCRVFAQRLVPEDLVFDVSPAHVMYFLDDSVGGDPADICERLHERPNAVSTTVVKVKYQQSPLNWGFRRKMSNSIHMKDHAPIDCIVRVDDVPKLVDTLIKLYPTSAKALKALEERVGGDAHSTAERSMHNFVVTAVCAVGRPVEAWVNDVLETLIEPESHAHPAADANLVSYCAFMTVFSPKRQLGLGVTVVDKHDGDDELTVSEEVWSRMCGPSGLFIDSSGDGRNLRVWNAHVGECVLKNTMPRLHESVVHQLLALMKCLTQKFPFRVAVKYLDVLLIGERQGSPLPPVLAWHANAGGKWRVFSNQIIPFVNKIQFQDPLAFVHLLVATSRACIYYPSSNRQDHAEALELAKQASQAAGSDDELLTLHNVATLHLVNKEWLKACEAFGMLLEKTADESRASSMFALALNGRKDAAGNFYYQGLEYAVKQCKAPGTLVEKAVDTLRRKHDHLLQPHEGQVETMLVNPRQKKPTPSSGAGAAG